MEFLIIVLNCITYINIINDKKNDYKLYFEHMSMISSYKNLTLNNLKMDFDYKFKVKHSRYLSI